MGAFATLIDRLADDTAVSGGEFADGVRALAQAVKAAEGERFRIDQDKPAGGAMYVIRIEDAHGRRLKTTLAREELAAGEDLMAMLAGKAGALAAAFMRLLADAHGLETL